MPSGVWPMKLLVSTAVWKKTASQTEFCHLFMLLTRVFDRLPDQNFATWNAMLSEYVQQGTAEEALNLYSKMQQEDFAPSNSVTFASLLQACASVGSRAVHEGKEIHARLQDRALQHAEVLGTCLIDIYAKCCSVEDACILFRQASRQECCSDDCRLFSVGDGSRSPQYLQ